jgi:hypothetical protein
MATNTKRAPRIYHPDNLFEHEVKRIFDSLHAVTDQLTENINQISVTISGGSVSGVPASRRIDTTAPLSGGGDLTVDRTLAVATFGAANSGVVPLSGGGTVNFLRADGSWASPPGAVDLATVLDEAMAHSMLLMGA